MISPAKIAEWKRLAAEAIQGWDRRSEYKACVDLTRTAVPELIEELSTLAKYIVDEHENLEERAPVSAHCSECNLGTGPHYLTCTYHRAKALTPKEPTNG